MVLGSVLFATAPVPIGWKSGTRLSSQPFPCQDRHCGCVTAEQCWTNCCCYGPEEHLAWAAQNGVEPPSYAIFGNTANTFESEHRSCCLTTNVSTIECNMSDANRSCAAESDDESYHSEAIMVLSVSAVRCQGGSSEFTLLPWAIIEDCQCSCSFPEPLFAPFEMQDEVLPSSVPQPDTPPPRAAWNCA